MNRTLTSLSMAFLKGSIELLLFFPLPLILILYVLPETMATRWFWFATLPFCYMAGYAAAGVPKLHKLFRLPLHACLIAIALLHAYMWYGGTNAFPYVWLLGWLPAYRGSRTISVPWLEFFPAGFYLVGMGVYFVASIFLRFVPSFEPYQPMLTWTGITALAVTLLTVNLSNLKSETLSGKRNPALASSVIKQNRVFIAFVYLAILFVATYRQLHEAVLWLKDMVFAGLSLVFRAGPPAVPVPAVEVGPPPSGSMPELNGEPSDWWIWLEKAAIVLVYIVVTSAILFFIYRFIRWLPRWLRRVFDWLIAFLHQGEQGDSGKGYVDDVESVIDWSQLREGFAGRFRGLLNGLGRREAKWDDLQNNRERVRFLYRAMLTTGVKTGYRLKPFLTPKETGRELEHLKREPSFSSRLIVTLYERVRYGDKDISDSEVAEAKQELEKRME